MTQTERSLSQVREQRSLLQQQGQETQQTRILLVGLVLAAGKGSRFSPDRRQSKLMAPGPDGRPLALCAAQALSTAMAPVYLAVGPTFPALKTLAEENGYASLWCPHAGLGQGHTIADAVAQLRRLHPQAAVCILPGDMPCVAASTVQRLRDAWLNLDDAARRKAVLAPVFQQQRGHPVLLGPDWLEPLSGLSGDEGAKQLIRPFLKTVPVEDPGCLQDIDTPSDLQALCAAPPAQVQRSL